MGTDKWWPLLALRVRTPRLELRVPSDDNLAALAELAGTRMHPAGEMPFATPWSALETVERQRSVVKHEWRSRGSVAAVFAHREEGPVGPQLRATER